MYICCFKDTQRRISLRFSNLFLLAFFFMIVYEASLAFANTSEFPSNLTGDSQGNFVQLFPDGTQKIVGKAVWALPAKATTEVKISGVLSSSISSAASVNIAQFLADPLRPGNSHFSIGFQVFDSLGLLHNLVVYFTKVDFNTWVYHVLAISSEVKVSVANSNLVSQNALVARSEIRFNSQGLLDIEDNLRYFNETEDGIDFSNGSTPGQRLVLDFGTSITTDGGSGDDGMVQQGSEMLIFSLSQNGYSHGTNSGTSVEDDGKIIQYFSNGQTLVVGQLLKDPVPPPRERLPRHHDAKKGPGWDGWPSHAPVAFPDTLKAEQSGVWSVGQLGAWRVNVDNDPSRPLAVHDVSSSPRTPWGRMLSFEFSPDRWSTGDITFHVPSSHRLHLKHVSLNSNLTGRWHGGKNGNIIAWVQTTFDGNPIRYDLGLSEVFRADDEGLRQVRYILSKPLSLYADAGTEVNIVVERNFNGPSQIGTVSLIGNFEDIP
ncbi:MAG: hypothetical protein KC643_28155 [Nitrospira sp.]|nr:hypothetical protein [Nitrospira sp.]